MPFSVDRFFTAGGEINKKGSGYDSWFHNYIPTGMRSSNFSLYGHASLPSSPSYIEAATMAAARTNPSRPYVDIPVSILDFNPAFESMKDRAKDLHGIKRIASTNLEYNFTVAPLIGDLIKLWRAQEMMDNRLKELERLHGKRGLRRTVSIGDYSAQTSKTLWVQSVGITLERTWRCQTTAKYRCHVRWGAQAGPGVKPSPAQMRLWAMKSVLGLTVDSSTLWELIPFSWLADYFGDIGTYLKATRNIVPATLRGCYPMWHKRSVWSCPSWESDSGKTKMNSASITRETKTRVVSSISPSAYFRILNARQVGILASLSAVRSPRRRQIARG